MRATVGDGIRIVKPPFRNNCPPDDRSLEKEGTQEGTLLL
jgi:hypothetical protein